MQLGKVIGNVVSTSKSSRLEGLRLLVVNCLNEALEPLPRRVVCTDTVNAKPGDIVLTCSSSSARCTQVTRDVCTDNTVVAIVDIISAGKKDFYRNG